MYVFCNCNIVREEEEEEEEEEEKEEEEEEMGKEELYQGPREEG